MGKIAAHPDGPPPLWSDTAAKDQFELAALQEVEGLPESKLRINTKEQCSSYQWLLMRVRSGRFLPKDFLGKRDIACLLTKHVEQV